MRILFPIALITLAFFAGPSARLHAGDLPIITNVDWQPFAAQIERLIEATDYLGSPFSSEDKAAVRKLIAAGNTKDSSSKLQGILDRRCLFGVQINPEMRVKVIQGAAKPELVEQGWRIFLVKVQNESGTTADLRALSPSAVSLFEPANTASDKALQRASKPNLDDRWLELQMF